MYAWMNKEGRWLRVNERTTHTGHHVTAEWTSDIHQASVLGRLPPKLGMIEARRVEVDVVEIRTVTVKVDFIDPVVGSIGEQHESL